MSFKCCNTEDHWLRDVLISMADISRSLEDELQRLAKEITGGGRSPLELDNVLIRTIGEDLRAGLMDGLGISPADVIDESTYRKIALMQQNVYQFAGFKTYRMLEEISLLQGLDSRQLNEAVRKLNRKYNRVYQAAERIYSESSGQMAAQWWSIEERAEDAPWLTYVDSDDDRVRYAHQLLDGITRRWDDPFWNTHYPPLGYRCRCDVYQSAEGTDTDLKGRTLPVIPRFFRNNVGKTNVVFNRNHPYFKADLTPRAERSIGRSALEVLAGEPIYHTLLKSGKGSLKVHPLFSKIDINENIATGKLLADNGEQVTLLSYINSTGLKQPDAMIGKRVADFKTIKDYKALHSAVQNSIRRAGNQGAEIAVLYIKGKMSDKEIKRGVWAVFGQGRSTTIKSVWIPEKERIIKIDREGVETENDITL